MNELALFAGAGGGILGGKLLGWRTVCAVEFDPHARAVLLARQADGCLERFPIWDDVRTFDGKQWSGKVDVVSGGFPCQDISSASSTRTGIDGERSGLWREMARIICEVGPRYVFVENSPMLTVRGLGTVLGDLAEMGFDARWGVLGAKSTGLPHNRERIWIVAHNHAQRGGSLSWGPAAVNRNMGRHIAIKPQIDRVLEMLESEGEQCKDAAEDCLPSYLCRVDDGLAYGVDRLSRIGNGQSAPVVALVWQLLTGLPSIGKDEGMNFQTLETCMHNKQLDKKNSTDKEGKQ